MSSMCLVEECIDCRWHVMKGLKLDCNYQNRLGLGKSELETYLGTETDEPEVEYIEPKVLGVEPEEEVEEKPEKEEKPDAEPSEMS